VVKLGEPLAWKPSVERIGRKRIRRREKDLAYAFKTGQINQPIKNLEDLGVVLGTDFSRVTQLVGLGVIKYLAVVYERNGREGVLVTELKGQGYGLPKPIAHESADTSLQTRTLRAGSNAARYKNKKVAIVGNGAIGSYVADLLFRSGVGKLTLIDPEKLRPGNIIRHIAGNQYMGWPKPMAVKATLAERGIDISDVHLSDDRITSAPQAIKLFTEHDLVIDATADLRATSVLEYIANELDRPLVAVWLQRQGGIARVDRFPLWDDEHHLPVIPPGEGEDAYEYGCGSPVSKTPPNAVVRAASLACEVALDQLNLGQRLPVTTIEIIESQPDEPYTKRGIITSNDD
jgi:molybdopterin/thiamine biosynthesis adenylyltransferase